MATYRGTRGNDDLFGSSPFNDLIICNRGNDNADGGAGNDNLRGEQGNDFLAGGDGADKLFGGVGNDFLSDTVFYNGNVDYSRDTLFGGNGNDTLIGGVGGDLMVGGVGNDQIVMMGGHAYGDFWSLTPSRGAVGNDVIVTDLSLDHGSERLMTGGNGRDTFQVTMSPWDDPTHVAILDFKPAEDAFVLASYIPWDGRVAYHQEMMAFLDSNHDGRLGLGDDQIIVDDNADGGSDASLTISMGNDSVTLHGVTDFVF